MGNSNKEIYSSPLEIDTRIAKIDKEIQILTSEKEELIKKKKQLNVPSKASSVSSNKDYSKNNFLWSSNILKLLQEQFKLKQFKPIQLKTINASLDKRDCILITPPGGGKSLCYQLPALLTGFTLIIEPLASLIQDQIRIAEKIGISCVSIDSNCPAKLQNEIFKAMQSDPVHNVTYKLIFTTPDKISSSKKLSKAIETAYNDQRLSRIVIDEIHCCSQMGHDFRSDYQNLNVLKSLYPNLPILGLTSTANNSIIADIKKSLNLNDDCLVYKDIYNISNLYYDVKFLLNDEKEGQEISKLIKSRFDGQSGIVYCFNQKDCETINNELLANGIKSSIYHGNLSHDVRKDTYNKWFSEQCKVIVATNVFGMGIDKPNVRFVIHMNMSKSLENYYQESGRAGRDGKRADCILFWKLSEYFKIGSNSFTDKVGITNLNVMNRYCLDESKCKRVTLSMILDEKFSEKDCGKMCSICTDNESQVSKVDITGIYKCALSIIENVEKSKNPKITGNKMIGELFNQMNDFIFSLANLYPGIDTKLFFDKAFSYLVLEGYLKLDFNFGSFSNFTYVVAGNNTIKSNEKINITIRISKSSKAGNIVSVKTNEPGNIRKNSLKRPFSEQKQELSGVKIQKR